MKATCSMPTFNDQFDAERGVVVSEEWQEKIKAAVNSLL